MTILETTDVALHAHGAERKGVALASPQGAPSLALLAKHLPHLLDDAFAQVPWSTVACETWFPPVELVHAAEPEWNERPSG